MPSSYSYSGQPKNPFRVFGLTPELVRRLGSIERLAQYLKGQYRALSAVFHEDVGGSLARQKEINAAYELLQDPKELWHWRELYLKPRADKLAKLEAELTQLRTYCAAREAQLVNVWRANSMARHKGEDVSLLALNNGRLILLDTFTGNMRAKMVRSPGTIVPQKNLEIEVAEGKVIQHDLKKIIFDPKSGSPNVPIGWIKQSNLPGQSWYWVRSGNPTPLEGVRLIGTIKNSDFKGFGSSASGYTSLLEGPPEQISAQIKSGFPLEMFRPYFHLVDPYLRYELSSSTDLSLKRLTTSILVGVKAEESQTFFMLFGMIMGIDLTEG